LRQPATGPQERLQSVQENLNGDHDEHTHQPFHGHQPALPQQPIEERRGQQDRAAEGPGNVSASSKGIFDEGVADSTILISSGVRVRGGMKSMSLTAPLSV
jgi:hypothetical protein